MENNTMIRTLDDAKALLTIDQIADSEADGVTWGEQEVELWRDQTHERPMPSWTLGEWCGALPEASSEVREAYEFVLDAKAREIWEAAREEA